jgi:hypothetical protein
VLFITYLQHPNPMAPAVGFCNAMLHRTSVLFSVLCTFQLDCQAAMLALFACWAWTGLN